MTQLTWNGPIELWNCGSIGMNNKLSELERDKKEHTVSKKKNIHGEKKHGNASNRRMTCWVVLGLLVVLTEWEWHAFFSSAGIQPCAHHLCIVKASHTGTLTTGTWINKIPQCTSVPVIICCNFCCVVNAVWWGMKRVWYVSKCFSFSLETAMNHVVWVLPLIDVQMEFQWLSWAC